MRGEPAKDVNSPKNIASAIVAKQADLFLLSEASGEIPPGNRDGYGLYYHDCRFLNGYEIRLADTAPNVLAASSGRGSVVDFELTNEAISPPDHQNGVPEQTFGIHLQRVIDGNLEGARAAVHDEFHITNYDVNAHRLPLSLRFESAFEPMFEIRGLVPKKVGRAENPRWESGSLVLSYNGADGLLRQTTIQFDPKPRSTNGTRAEFLFQLGAGETASLCVSATISEQSESKAAPPTGILRHLQRVSDARDSSSQQWLERHTRLRSDNPALNSTIQRSLLDLEMLQTGLHGSHYYSAGLPWYAALFGRDSLISALQTMAFSTATAESTLRLLASYQGTKHDEYRDEEPGKILHELRDGELAHLNEIPQTPYYGSVDATPLFLIALCEYVNWSGKLELFTQLRSNVERALSWIDSNMRHYGGYLSYATKSSKGLGNQGWKDSGDSVMNADGSLAVQPIALVEVQGYVYRAQHSVAGLYDAIADQTRATQLRQQAEALKERFNRDFWMPEKKFLAIALQQGGKPAQVVSSNPGQALWTGIVDQRHAGAIAQRLAADDMFNGWGIRTLSAGERRYNPVGYHLGTVWPHDNSVIAAGLKRYGFAEQAHSVMSAILDAATHFEHHRLPEVFAGYDRKQFSMPVRYPVACHPQAWAAGAVPLLLTSLLGLQADALHHRLVITNPLLPPGASHLELHGVRIGGASLDLRFQTEGGRVYVDTLRSEGSTSKGSIDVVVQPQSSPAQAA